MSADLTGVGEERLFDTHAHHPTSEFLHDAGGEMMRDAASVAGSTGRLLREAEEPIVGCLAPRPDERLVGVAPELSDARNGLVPRLVGLEPLEAGWQCLA